MPRKVVLINDPGIDGAFAIALALNEPDLEVVGLLATAGNVGADQATKNIRIILDQLDPPRWPRVGTAPQVEYDVDGTKLHGPTGLGHTDFPCAAPHHLVPSEKLLVELAKQFPHELTIVCLGPSTVIARAMDLWPELPTVLDRIVLVGGSVREPGNAGPVSEFHVYCDPKAARKVIQSGAPITLAPLDMMRKVLYSPTDLLAGASELSPVYPFLRQVIPFGIAATSHLYGIEGFHLKDVLGVIAVAFPEAVTTEMMYVDVEVEGEPTRGMTVVDRRSWHPSKHNVAVMTEIEAKSVRDYVRRVIGY